MGESPQMIIAMLTRYFIQLVRAAELRRRRASEHEVASALRISPYFVKNIIEASGNFSSSHIDHCFAALRDADVELKSSGREPALVLDLLIYSLVRGDVVRPTDYFLV
ncbi:MAG: hypothetical protein HY966_00030 [Ignavibacteriales bacterium]|nr:hypothetical protein [Ignavibacteriales bacterium]